MLYLATLALALAASVQALSDSPPSGQHAVEDADADEPCLRLSAASFEQVALDPSRSVLVYFHAPWCGHCKKLTPQYKATCAAFASEPHVTLAMLDGTDASPLRERFEVNGYPRLLMFPEVAAGETKQHKVYEGPRKHRDITAFVNEHAGTSRLVNGTLGPDAALVPALDAIVTTAKAFDEDFLQVLETAIAGIEQASGYTKQEQKNSYKLYRQYAQKTVAKGESFPQEEAQRLSRLMSNPTTKPAKVEEFQKKYNVVTKFLGGEFMAYTGEEGRGLVQTLDRMIAAAPALDDAFATELEAAAAELAMDTTQYVLYAKKIAGNGEGYIEKELKRLSGLLSSKSVLKHKKQGLQTRFNVLRQFQRLRQPQSEENASEGQEKEL